MAKLAIIIPRNLLISCLFFHSTCSMDDLQWYEVNNELVLHVMEINQ